MDTAYSPLASSRSAAVVFKTITTYLSKTISEVSSNYVSENDSEKDLTLRMSDDDAEEEQLKSKQQQDEALIDKVFNHPGIFKYIHCVKYV